MGSADRPRVSLSQCGLTALGTPAAPTSCGQPGGSSFSPPHCRWAAPMSRRHRSCTSPARFLNSHGPSLCLLPRWPSALLSELLCGPFGFCWLLQQSVLTGQLCPSSCDVSPEGQVSLISPACPVSSFKWIHRVAGRVGGALLGVLHVLTSAAHPALARPHALD